MPYGLLTPDMEALMAPYVAGKVVWDLGAGDLTYARLLASLGAARVVAVEKELHPVLDSCWDTRIQVFGTYFDKVVPPETIEVAFLSWPVNHPVPGLTRLLERAEVVIYLGCNTDMSACGTPELFRDHLCGRALLGHLPHRRNSMMIYGDCGGRVGPLTGEEFAAVTGAAMPFEAAQEQAASFTGHWK